MTSPGGAEVGRVSIRVVPDTSKFARELRRKLNAIEKSEELTIPVKFEADREQLRRELEKLRVRAIQVPIEPDFTGFSRELNNRLRAVKPTAVKVPAEPDLARFRTSLNSQLRAIKPNALKVPAEPDLTGFRTQLNNAVRAVRPTPVKVGAEPDLTTFRAQLRAQLAATQQSVTVPVELNPNLASLRARLRALNETVRVDLNPNTTTFRAALRALSGSVRVDLVPNITDFRARLRAISAQVRVDLNPNITAFRARLRALDGTVNVNVDVNEALIAARIATAIRAGAALGSIGLGGTISKGVGSGFNIGTWTTVLRIVAQIVGYLTLASAAAFALVVAGAAVAAAWGAASTAILAIPGILVGLAPALAAVALGMDGIKKAAETLRPEFDRMKKAVNDTFQKGFTEAFKIVKPIFPTIHAGMVGVAKAINEVAINLAKFAREAQNAGLIEQAFGRLQGFIIAMSPALNDLVFSFLQIAGVKELWDGLGLAIQRTAAAVKTAVGEMLKNGSLQEAFRGLGEVVGSLGQAFVDLVQNGVELFRNAWPGVQRIIDSLGNFFNRFDWNSLGVAVSDVFTGLAEALDRVPQATIDQIVNGFRNLGATFRDANFQQMLVNIISAIPIVIQVLNNLMTTFARVGSFAAGLVTILQGVGKMFGAFAMAMADPIGTALNPEKFRRAFGEAQAEIALGGKMLGDAFKSVQQEALTGANGIPLAIVEPLRRTGQQINTLTPEIAAAVNELGGRSANAAERAMQGVSAAAATGLQPLPGQVEGIVQPVPQSVGTALQPAAQAATDALSQVSGAVDTSIGDLGARVTTAMSNVNTSLGNGTRTWAPTVTTGMAAIKTEMDTGFTNLTTSATTGLQGVTDAFNTQGPQWAASVGLSMNTVTNSFVLGFNNMKLAADTGMLSIQTAFTTGWQVIATTLTTQTNAWAAIISLGFNTIANSATLGIQLLVTAVTTGMTSVQTAFTTGLTAINAAIVTASAQWAATLSLALNTLLNTVVVGFTSIVTAVTNGLLAVQNAFTTNWSTIATGLQTAMQTCVTTVQNGMTQMVNLANQGMSEMVTTITNGTNQAVNVLTNGVNRMLTVLRNAVGQFRTAGANMGQALADGLNSKAAAVEAAARRLANAAAAAVRAAAGMHSPSRVFINLGELIGVGFALGIESQEHRVEQAAKGLVTDIENYVKAAANTASDLSSQVEFAPFVSNARLVASTVPAAATSGGIEITNNIYNPLPETGSDSVAKVQRRQARLGLFGTP